MEQFNVRPIDYSSIKIGHYVFIKTHPCKITNASHAKPGKHGATKVAMTGIDVLTNKKYECCGAGHLRTKQFDLVRATLQLISLEDETITCLTKGDECEQLLYSLTEDDPMYSEIQKSLAKNSDKDIYVTILLAPIEKSDDEYITGHLVESCKYDA